jgi:TetR/AcrR family transcriptional regulator
VAFAKMDQHRNEVGSVYSRFESLDPEKRQRIINAAIEEFARNGYEKASTNEIVKTAQISKGSLFNYFNSKKDLYLFLFEYIRSVIDTIYDEVDVNQRDFFERLRELGLIKYRIMKQFPQAFDFLKAASQEDAPEVKPELNKIGKSFIEKGFEKMYENIDFTKFREDMDLQKVLKIIYWSVLGFADEQVSHLDSYENVTMEHLREWDDYFDILKRCFYKQES